jgi:hypothetical protein
MHLYYLPAVRVATLKAQFTRMFQVKMVPADSAS